MVAVLLPCLLHLSLSKVYSAYYYLELGRLSPDIGLLRKATSHLLEQVVVVVPKTLYRHSSDWIRVLLEAKTRQVGRQRETRLQVESDR